MKKDREFVKKKFVLTKKVFVFSSSFVGFFSVLTLLFLSESSFVPFALCLFAANVCFWVSVNSFLSLRFMAWGLKGFEQN